MNFDRIPFLGDQPELSQDLTADPPVIVLDELGGIEKNDCHFQGMIFVNRSKNLEL